MNTGTAIYSRFAGTIVDSQSGVLGLRTTAGTIVYLLHGYCVGAFCNIQQSVHVGDELITSACVPPAGGSCSGPHLHLEVHKSVVGELSVSTGPGDDINPEQWLVGGNQVDGLQGDVNGDGLTDLVAVNETSVFVTLSTGSTFQPPTSWWNAPSPPSSPGIPPFGARATLLGDVTGTHKADLVAVNDNSVWVMLSSGTGFHSPTQWSSASFYGTRATLLADVTGNGLADLVAVNDTSIFVMLSSGTGFGPPTQWTAPSFFGNVVTLLGDVNGDHKADLVAVNSTSTWVMTSTGSGFSSPAQWAVTPFYGTRATLVGDVNGDGPFDLVAVNESSVWVMLSSGTGFGSPNQWLNTSSPTPYGTRATVLGSEYVPRWPDLVAVNDGNTYVMPSTVSNFGTPTLWSSQPFYGSHATI